MREALAFETGHSVTLHRAHQHAYWRSNRAIFCCGQSPTWHSGMVQALHLRGDAWWRQVGPRGYALGRFTPGIGAVRGG